MPLTLLKFLAGLCFNGLRFQARVEVYHVFPIILPSESVLLFNLLVCYFSSLPHMMAVFSRILSVWYKCLGRECACDVV